LTKTSILEDNAGQDSESKNKGKGRDGEMIMKGKDD
jgi:hypothetical protein